jgi:hypothetical protein
MVKKRFLEYIELLNSDPNGYGLISFYLTHLEKLYTKSEIFNFFNVDENIKNTPQCLAGIQIIKKINIQLI